MPCKNPCRLYIHLAFTYSVGPSTFSTNESAWSVTVTGSQSRVWSDLGQHGTLSKAYTRVSHEDFAWNIDATYISSKRKLPQSHVLGSRLYRSSFLGFQPSLNDLTSFLSYIHFRIYANKVNLNGLFEKVAYHRQSSMDTMLSQGCIIMQHMCFGGVSSPNYLNATLIDQFRAFKLVMYTLIFICWLKCNIATIFVWHKFMNTTILDET